MEIFLSTNGSTESHFWISSVRGVVAMIVSLLMSTSSIDWCCKSMMATQGIVSKDCGSGCPSISGNNASRSTIGRVVSGENESYGVWAKLRHAQAVKRSKQYVGRRTLMNKKKKDSFTYFLATISFAALHLTKNMI